MKRWTILSLFLSGILMISGCSSDNITSDSGNSNASGTSQAVSADATSVNTSEMFTDRDMEIGYDEETAAKIVLSGKSASCNSDEVQISDNKITITDEGTYIISGKLNDGMIIVNTDDSKKVQLVLDGADITSSDSAAIYVLSADKVFITTASESENTLSNGGEYVAVDDNNIDSVIFSKSDLTLNGSGTLTINAAAGHGVVSKDDLVLTSGNYNITAASHGISGKDSVRIAGGNYTIASDKDGIHSENSDDTSLGFLYIADGTFNITAQGDGMSAGAYLQADNGEYTIKAGGGSANAASQSSEQDFMGRMEMVQTDDTDDTDDTASTKGIKAATDLIITNGTFTIDSADDSLHSNGNLAISGGTFEISSGDDGMHADSALTISGGNINITQSYEGIEGLTIDISGGDISLVSSDDGLNAAGGNDSSGFEGRGGDMFASEEGVYINISGGTLNIVAEGDGVDSNGDLTVTGGNTYVSGPSNSGNGSLDCNGEAVISGGIFVAAGASGMVENFGNSSTQGVMMVTVNAGSDGDTISLSDSSGNELVSWQTEKAYSCVIISCPEITQGSSYTLTAGSYTTEITMDSLVYGSGSGMGGGMRGGQDRDMGGGMMDGQDRDMGDGMNGGNGMYGRP